MTESELHDRTLLVRRDRAVGGRDGIHDHAHYLVLIEGAELGRRVEISAAPVTIGRDSTQSLVLADTDVSRRHARVSLVAGAVVIEDLGSTNGTFLDASRLETPAVLNDGNVVRIGGSVFKYEHRSRREVEQTEELARDLAKASSYVHALLPAPLIQGPIRTDWRFVPSAALGGDAFGYYWLDANTFVFYLLDVSGHGVGAAMHSVTILNVLRQRALPGVDFRDPGRVLASLNEAFPMDSHGGMYFTMWYGVYDMATRALRFSAGGHHPAFVVSGHDRETQSVGKAALMLGAMPGVAYQTEDLVLAPASALYLFSDGVFEVELTSGRRSTLADFVPLLAESPVPDVGEAERLLRRVRGSAAPDGFDDDVSLLTVMFP